MIIRLQCDPASHSVHDRSIGAKIEAYHCLQGCDAAWAKTFQDAKFGAYDEIETTQLSFLRNREEGGEKDDLKEIA